MLRTNVTIELERRFEQEGCLSELLRRQYGPGTTTVKLMDGTVIAKVRISTTGKNDNEEIPF